MNRFYRLNAGEGAVPVPSPSNGEPPAPTPVADDHAAKIREAEALLKAEGHQVLNSAAFHGVKTKAAADAEARLAEAQKRLDKALADNAALNEYKTGIENQGKSEAELLSARQLAWEKSDAEKTTAIREANKATEALQAKLDQERVENRIRSLMGNSTNPDAALMWAQKHIGERLSTDESGQLVWTTETGVPHIGIAAEKLVNEWWSSDGQKFLHAGNVPGPPTSGAPSPAPQTKAVFEPDPTKTTVENMLAAEEFDRARRLKG